jgi:hypothetical protein
MDVFKSIESQPLEYLRQAIDLCVQAYDPIDAIKHHVAHKVKGPHGEKFCVVWGPVQTTDRFGVAKSLLFIAINESSNEHYVVMRGTNPDSLTSWVTEDFEVGEKRDFADLFGNPPAVPQNTWISKGSFHGTNLLARMRDHQLKQSAVEYLKAAAPPAIYVTGHSLGGTVTPCFFAYLNAMLFGGAPVTKMALWSFAGLTPGGSEFNNYFNAMLVHQPHFLWRVHNDLDIAPLLWCAESKVRSIYSAHGLAISDPADWLLSYLFHQAQNSGIHYTQAQAAGFTLDGNYCGTEISWVGQALYHHHATTYQSLIHALTLKLSAAKV